GSHIFVEHDSAINTAVRKVRRALGDDADNPRFIETVVAKGYRFIAPIERGPDSPERGSAIKASGFPRYCLTRGRDEFIMSAGENLLGRDAGARVHVNHPSVSRHHACIAIESDRAILKDLKSLNGTFVDGRRVDAPTEIRHGAVIGLGPITLT